MFQGRVRIVNEEEPERRAPKARESRPAGPRAGGGFLGWGTTSPPPQQLGDLGAEPQPKSNLVLFRLKTWHLVATNLVIFVRVS